MAAPFVAWAGDFNARAPPGGWTSPDADDLLDEIEPFGTVRDEQHRAVASSGEDIVDATASMRAATALTP
jgi:hypothetical protein